MERVEYPELQRRAGVEGTAILQFIVSAEGTVEDLFVVQSSGNDGLDRAALEAVRLTRFTPGMVDDEPVRVRFALPITFRLPETDAPSDDRVREVRPDPEGEDGVYGVVDDMPQLLGGLQGLQDRLVYPQVAKDAGIEGQVIVQFIVSESGEVQDAVVLRSPDDVLSEAALQAVRQSRFEPGRIGDQAVKVRFAVPITFRLPAGDGVDRGERLDGDRPEGTVRYAGVDTSRLTPGSRQAFESTLRGLPEIIGRRSRASRDIEVRYTVGPDGRNGGAEYVAGDRSLMHLAAGLVGTLETADDARPGPGGSWTGTFRLWYVAQG